MSVQCTVVKPSVYGGYWFKIPTPFSPETVESFLKEMTKRIGMDPGQWEKLSDANWGNNELEYRLSDGKCRPTLDSLLKAKYLNVPSVWPKTNLVTDIDDSGSRSRLDLSDRRGMQFDPSLDQSGDVYRYPDPSNVRVGTSYLDEPIVWVAGLGAAGLLAYFLLKKG